MQRVTHSTTRGYYLWCLVVTRVNSRVNATRVLFNFDFKDKIFVLVLLMILIYLCMEISSYYLIIGKIRTQVGDSMYLAVMA